MTAGNRKLGHNNIFGYVLPVQQRHLKKGIHIKKSIKLIGIKCLFLSLVCSIFSMKSVFNHYIWFNQSSSSIIRPYIIYCCHIWSSAPDIYLDITDNIQSIICNVIGSDLAFRLQPFSRCRNVFSLCFFL